MISRQRPCHSLFLRPPLQFPYIAFDPLFRCVIVFKLLFVAAKCGRVVVAAAVVMHGRVVNMEHFVEDHVIDDEWRGALVVKRTADHDRIVCRIVMPKDAVGPSGRPGQDRAGKPAVEMLLVQSVEDRDKVKMLALVRGYHLPAHLPPVFGRQFADLGAFLIRPIGILGPLRHTAAKDL